MGKLFNVEGRTSFGFSPMRVVLQAFFFFVGISVCLAQKEVRFERISVDQGLSQSSISGITQDQYGYLWVATLDGLNRYDGQDFKIYRHNNDNPKSLYRNHVTKLLLDGGKTLWVCHDGAIARYNPHADNFDNFSLPHNSAVHDLAEVSDSLLTLCTNNGILQLNTHSGLVTTSDVYRSFVDQNINNLFTDTHGNSWVAGLYMLYKKEKHSKNWTTIFSDKIGVRVIYHEPSGDIYMQRKTALYKFDEITGRFEVIDKFEVNEDFDQNNFGMIKLSNGELWLFRRAIHIYNSEDKKIATLSNIPQNPTSISGDYLSCIFESNDQVVWIGTNGFGLNKYNPVLSIFKYVASYEATPLTLSNNFVYSVFTDDDNLIYTGTFSGLDILNLKQNRSEHYRLTGKDGRRARPQRIFKDRRGVVWLCTDRGLMRVDKGIRPSGIMMLDTMNIYDVTSTSPDTYYLSTDEGIFVFDPSKNSSSRIYPNGGIPIGLMDSILWTESEHAITEINPLTGKLIQTINKKNDDDHAFRQFPIKCFYQDSQGRKWIGSWGSGLTLLRDDGTFEYFDENDGLPNAVVYGILEDSANNLWLSTNKGLCVFNIEQKRGVRNFYKADGLQGDEFNTRAFHKSPGGKFYFGGTNGLTFFDPKEAMAINVDVPKTILTNFFINNVRVERFQNVNIHEPDVDDEIVLNSNERDFSFEIAGLGFSFPGRTEHKYILENYSSDWASVGNQRMISFTNIPPGHYTFRAKSANSFGEWEKEGLVLKIVVKGPFYNTAWFRLTMLAIFAVSIYVYYRQRTAFLRARAQYLESLVLDRTRKIQSMNDEIAAQNEELASQSESLSAQNDELTAIKTSLERMVDERTVELQKLNTELIKQNSQLEQFAFITAHNIRGPVARIKGLLQFIPKSKMEELTYLESSINDLDQVISDLSTILDVRYGHEKLFEPVKLKPIISQILRTIDDQVMKRGAVVDWKEFRDISVMGIQSYFNSILYNLLHNAVKYADPTRPLVITIRTKRDEKATYIEIEDNGLGIDMRYAKEKIFSLYQRFHPSIKGKGFGLFLVKIQVEAMNGSINVKSEVNKGTIFQIIVRSA